MASGRQKITKGEDVQGGCERGMIIGGGVGYRIRLPRGLAPLRVPAIWNTRRRYESRPEVVGADEEGGCTPASVALVTVSLRVTVDLVMRTNRTRSN